MDDWYRVSLFQETIQTNPIISMISHHHQHLPYLPLHPNYASPSYPNKSNPRREGAANSCGDPPKAAKRLEKRRPRSKTPRNSAQGLGFLLGGSPFTWTICISTNESGQIIIFHKPELRPFGDDFPY